MILGYYHDFKTSEVNSYNNARDFSVISGIPIVKKDMGQQRQALKRKRVEIISMQIFKLRISNVKVAKYIISECTQERSHIVTIFATKFLYQNIIL